MNDETHFEDDAPLSEVENIQGWRRVQVLPMGILASPQQAEAMLERVSPPARCLALEYSTQDVSHHKPPVHGCCGWHAMYDEKRGDGHVHILVSAIGETLLCREGFIAEQIRVDEVRVPHGFDEKLSRKIGERYQVPVYEQEEQECASEIPSSASSPSPWQYQQAYQPQPFRPLIPRQFQPGNLLPIPSLLQNQFPSGFAQEAQKIAEERFMREVRKISIKRLQHALACRDAKCSHA